MNDSLNRDCHEFMDFCRGVRHGAQRGDVGLVKRLNAEAGRLMSSFQDHWAATESALRTSASDGELTRLQGQLREVLSQVQLHQDAMSRILFEMGSGPREAVTPEGLAVGPGLALDFPNSRRFPSDTAEQPSFPAVPIP